MSAEEEAHAVDQALALANHKFHGLCQAQLYPSGLCTDRATLLVLVNDEQPEWGQFCPECVAEWRRESCPVVATPTE